MSYADDLENRIEALEKQLRISETELEAVKRWLIVLYALTKNQTLITPERINEIIRNWKNAGPSSQIPVPPSAQDEIELELLPVVEKVGSEIAEYLQSLGSSLQTDYQ